MLSVGMVFDFQHCQSDGSWFYDWVSKPPKHENVQQFAYSSCPQLAFRSQFYAYITSSHGGAPS